MEIVSPPRQTENKRPVDRSADVLQTGDRVKMCGRCRSPPRLHQKQLENRWTRTSARKSFTVEGNSHGDHYSLKHVGPIAVGGTCTNEVVEIEEVFSLHKAGFGSLGLCRLPLPRRTWGIPMLGLKFFRGPYSSLSLHWLVNGS